MKFRKACALVAVVAAGFGLTACQPKAGAAAIVGDQRISESSVDQYLTPQSSPYPVQNQDGSTSTVVPRNLVLNTLILTDLFTAALNANGGPPTGPETAAARQQLLSGSSEDQVTKSLTTAGFTSSFEPVILNENVQLNILRTRLHVTTSDQPVVDAIHKLDMPVQANPRYGVWDEKSLNLGTPQAPPFLTLNTSAATATPAG